MVAFVLMTCGLLIMALSVPAYRPSNSALRVIRTAYWAMVDQGVW